MEEPQSIFEVITVNANSQRIIEQFGQTMAKLGALTRKDEATVLTSQGKNLGRRMIDLTPTPKSRASGNVATYGKKVIGKYFARVARPLFTGVWHAPGLDEAIREGDIEKTQASLRSVMKNPYINVVKWDKSLVYRNMNSRGQVLHENKTQFTIAGTQWKADLKKARSSVLKAKGGWASGWAKLGGKPTAQIRKQEGEGTFVDGRKHLDPAFLFTNFSAWGKRSDEALRITLNAEVGGIRAMESQMQKMEEARLKSIAARAK